MKVVAKEECEKLTKMWGRGQTIWIENRRVMEKLIRVGARSVTARKTGSKGASRPKWANGHGHELQSCSTSVFLGS